MPGNVTLYFKSLFLFGFTSLILASCGLKYIPQESPQDFELRRQKKVETYVKEQFGTDSIHYSSIAFGPSRIVKPLSYQKLDSLYAVKFQNEQTGEKDNGLEDKILMQQNIARNDTNKVIYVENHFFSIGSKDTVEFYNSYFQLNNDLSIYDLTIEESVFLPKKYEQLYKVYLFEESFLNSGYLANSEELSFYQLYKVQADNLSSNKKDQFIAHTLDIMDEASHIHTLRTEELLKRLVTKKYFGASYAEKYDYKISTSQINTINDLGQSYISGYLVSLTFNEKKDPNKVQHLYVLEYDPYLQLVSEAMD